MPLSLWKETLLRIHKGGGEVEDEGEVFSVVASSHTSAFLNHDTSCCICSQSYKPCTKTNRGPLLAMPPGSGNLVNRFLIAPFMI